MPETLSSVRGGRFDLGIHSLCALPSDMRRGPVLASHRWWLVDLVDIPLLVFPLVRGFSLPEIAD